ncbi:MAG: OadG family protein [Bacteroidales bacterium]|nr:OadG family protein [Bacteroidales bacterium]MDD4215879.1 OadG family protein [Bacteroidales bacterium]MDY0140667.1 OadG family protein [Bacteroidales bacterium]
MLTILSAVSFDVSNIDANAMTLFIIGFSVVFGALIVIYLLFFFMPKIINFDNIGKGKKKKKNKKQKTEAEKTTEVTENSELYAAIAMALHLHFEDTHDLESMVLTMDIQDRVSSQWSSKIININ